MERLEIRDMEPEDETYVGSCGHLNDPDYSAESAEPHIKRLRNACVTKGLRIKVALLYGEHAGFTHIYPIESCPWGPMGKDLSVVLCVNVAGEKRYTNGIGSGLMKAAEGEARVQHRKGVVAKAYYSDSQFFMPALFFERCGYTRVRGPRPVSIKGMDKHLSNETLLWKVFDHTAEPPLFLERNYRYRPVPGKVVVDLFHTSSSPCYTYERDRVREVCSEFGDRIVLNQYNADDPEVLRTYQIYRGIFINGREIGWGNDAPKTGIRQAIQDAM